jgi:uncharacterized protein
MQTEYSTGTIFEPQNIAGNSNTQQWENWTPFENKSCSACKILPVCAGFCPYKFLYRDVTRGEAGKLPCPSWKYSMNERLLWQAQAAGYITEADMLPVEQTREPLPVHEIWTEAQAKSRISNVTFHTETPPQI